MADFVFNIAKGRIVQFYDNIDSNNPANSAFVAVVLRTTGLAPDSSLIDYDDLNTIKTNSPEVANVGYSRITLTDTDLAAWSPTDASDRVDLDIIDLSFGAITAGDGWSKLLLCYDNDVTTGTDANVIPCLAWDFVVVPDGTAITAVINASGILRVT